MVQRDTKIGQVLEVKVTHHSYQHGIEIKIDSMQNDGSQSWIVISRGVTKDVTELLDENEQPIHLEEVAPSAAKLVGDKAHKV